MYFYNLHTFEKVIEIVTDLGIDDKVSAIVYAQHYCSVNDIHSMFYVLNLINTIILLLFIDGENFKL